MAACRTDFDTRELTVGGDAVEVLQTCAGWSFCAGDGAVGWIPDRCLNIASAG
jgi:hypothetical protein